jgi:3-deoxy-D-manno-octulosonic-acid transferase
MPRNLYTALFCLLLPVYFVRLCWKGLSNKEYFLRWSERLGFGSEIPSKGKSLIWIHAVSVGEVNASMPLLRRLITDHPHSELLVTTTTPTGSRLLIERLGNKIKHQYLPVDIPFFLNYFLNKWNPKILILLETEIWPNLINICKRRAIYTALVNARLSEKSKNNYLKYNSLMKPAIEKIDLILAQFESDKRRFLDIVDRKDINTCGNLKFDQDIPSELEDISKTIKQDWSIDGELRPILIAASTHETEEDEVLKAFKKILISSPNALLILVPRHLERFDRVKKIIQASGLALVSRSKKEDVKKNTQVLLGDTIGELNFLYSLSDVAFVGGSLIDHGGQNLLEPAAQGLALISGPSLRNFSDISDQLIKKQCLAVIRSSEELSEKFIELVENPDVLKKSGEAAFEVFMTNRGALEKIINYLQEPLQA